VKVPKETLLTPRFYTTDFDEMARMDISVNEAELRALLEEFRVTTIAITLSGMQNLNNPGHIDGRLARCLLNSWSVPAAEFSGFLLYKELSRRLRTKALAESFNLMSRDEARHAGFLNKALSDFRSWIWDF